MSQLKSGAGSINMKEMDKVSADFFKHFVREKALRLNPEHPKEALLSLPDRFEHYEKKADASLNPRNKLYFMSEFVRMASVKGKSDASHLVERYLKKNHLEPNYLLLNSLLLSSRRDGNIDQAFHYLKELQERGYVPDVVSYGAVVETCVKAKNLEKAMEVLEMMKVAEPIPIKPNQVRVWCVVCGVWCEGWGGGARRAGRQGE